MSEYSSPLFSNSLYFNVMYNRIILHYIIQYPDIMTSALRKLRKKIQLFTVFGDNYDIRDDEL